VGSTAETDGLMGLASCCLMTLGSTTEGAASDLRQPPLTKFTATQALQPVAAGAIRQELVSGTQ